MPGIGIARGDVPRRGDAQWATPTGTLVYGRFELVELTYNGAQ